MKNFYDTILGKQIKIGYRIIEEMEKEHDDKRKQILYNLLLELFPEINLKK